MAEFDTKGALRIIEQAQYMVMHLKAQPAMVPIVREILAPTFRSNGAAAVEAPARAKRPMSEATRRKMRAAAKKRWAEKRKQG